MKRRDWDDLLAWACLAMIAAAIGGGIWLGLLAWSAWLGR